MIKVSIGSTNPVKIEAARAGFEKVFVGQEIVFNSFKSNSGVSDQPMSEEETFHGALNRAKSVMEISDADFVVGQEGGILKNTLLGLCSFAIVVVMNKKGEYKWARTITYPLPLKVVEELNNGHELGKANDLVFGLENSKQGLGASGIYTNGLLPRAMIYEDAVIMALSLLLRN